MEPALGKLETAPVVGPMGSITLSLLYWPTTLVVVQMVECGLTLVLLHTIQGLGCFTWRSCGSQKNTQEETSGRARSIAIAGNIIYSRSGQSVVENVFGIL